MLAGNEEFDVYTRVGGSLDWDGARESMGSLRDGDEVLLQVIHGLIMDGDRSEVNERQGRAASCRDEKGDELRELTEMRGLPRCQGSDNEQMFVLRLTKCLL